MQIAFTESDIYMLTVMMIQIQKYQSEAFGKLEDKKKVTAKPGDRLEQYTQFSLSLSLSTPFFRT